MKLNPEAGTPFYLQIAELIRQQILEGNYCAGAKLPSVRDLAVKLRVNPNTVARAYAMLQSEGVLEGRHGGGSFVTQSEETTHILARRTVEEELRHAMESAARFGISADELRVLFETAMQQK